MSFIAPPKPAARPRHQAARPRRQPPEPADKGRWIVVPHASERVQKREALRRARLRRRRALAALGLVAIATAGAAVLQGGAWLELHLMADGVLVFYVAMLMETKRRHDERATKVLRIPQPQSDDVIVFESVRAGADS